MKEAYLLHDDILLKGIAKRKLFRKIFIPNNSGCEFSYQYIHRRDVGYFLFYSINDIKKAGLDHLKIIE